jgi:hypothetical protein
MIKRAILLGLCGLGLLGLARTGSAQQPDQTKDRAERVRALQRQIMDLEAIGRAKVMQQRGLTQRPAVTASDNVDSFTPVVARFVRFNVLATVSGDEPCLDVLDLYGPHTSANLTAAAGVRLTASSIWPGHLGDFKDGKYGKGWCWVGKERGTGWLQVELPVPATITRLVWGRDAQKRHQDRVATVYKIEVSEDGRAWHTVATGADRLQPGTQQVVLRSAAVKALDPGQQKERQGLLDELRKLGATWPIAVQSGPQVGEGINGGFSVRGLNASLSGRSYCPV